MFWRNAFTLALFCVFQRNISFMKRLHTTKRIPYIKLNQILSKSVESASETPFIPTLKGFPTKINTIVPNSDIEMIRLRQIAVAR